MNLHCCLVSGQLANRKEHLFADGHVGSSFLHAGCIKPGDSSFFLMPVQSTCLGCLHGKTRHRKALLSQENRAQSTRIPECNSCHKKLACHTPAKFLPNTIPLWLPFGLPQGYRQTSKIHPFLPLKTRTSELLQRGDCDLSPKANSSTAASRLSLQAVAKPAPLQP